MLQLVNHSPFAPGMFLFPNEVGIDTIYAVVKATFDLSFDKPAPAAMQTPVTLTDEYHGAPDGSSLKLASEAHLTKPGTDVIVVGDALAPDDREVTSLDVSLSVGDRYEEIKVWGDRAWKGTGLKSWPGEPAPFTRMPMVFERSFGGMQTIEQSDGTVEVLSEPFNPVGRGFRGRRSFDELKAEPVPNLEDPKYPVTSMRSKARPVGFGFVAPWWAPRMHFAGTYDAAWQKHRSPYLPDDFDLRFFNAAPEGWVFEEQLEGGAPVSIRNMSPGGELSFEVPRLDLGIEITVAGKVETPPLRLETLLIEPNALRCSMTFRAKVACDKKALAVSEVRIVG